MIRASMGGTASLDIQQILERLPHRYPMLLVDRVIEVEAGRRLAALKNVTINEEFFRGHFPGSPIMPGVLILEALAQAAGLLASATIEGRGQVFPYLVGVDEVKFRRPVVPGDQLRLDVTLVQSRGRYWRFQAAASVLGERATEAELLLALLPADPPAGPGGSR